MAISEIFVVQDEFLCRMICDRVYSLSIIIPVNGSIFCTPNLSDSTRNLVPPCSPYTVISNEHNLWSLLGILPKLAKFYMFIHSSSVLHCHKCGTAEE